MDRCWLMYIVDVVLGLSFLVVFVTGILKFQGVLSLLGIRSSLRALSAAHDIAGVLLGAAALAHLFFHWRWIVAMTKRALTKKPVASSAAPCVR